MEAQPTAKPTRKRKSPEPAAPALSSPYDVAPDVAGLKTLMVNVFFVGKPGPGNPWVLIDAGMPGYAGQIKTKAEALFGPGTKPQAIVLTHGHFDHIGSLEKLLAVWNVPVWAHPLELPYLRGKSSYPPPDPAIGGGLMAYTSFIFPIGPEDFGDRIAPIDGDTIPELPDWRVYHTPGHAPGHISLFRKRDRTLIAGDAFVMTNQSSLWAVATQREELLGPPQYFTCNWNDARQSVQTLADLKPLAAGTGHGHAIRSQDLPTQLHDLVAHFNERAIPSAGRYVRDPAIANESGVVHMPAPTSFLVGRALGVGLLVGALLFAFWPKGRR